MTTRRDKCCSLLVEYIYLLWDGMTFFGFDDNKIKRLDGVKPRWYDRFTNKRWLLFNFTFVAAFMAVCVSEFNLLGNIKS